MVVEMTSLQGTIGRYYALDSGEAQAVADAIFEHYLPKSAGDSSPKSKIAFAVGLADRLDSLTGLFAVGLAPTGNKDPFGLRRAALGLVQMLVDWDQDFDLVFALRAASKRQPVEVAWSTQGEVLEFIAGRLSNQLRDDGYRYDVVEAVSASQAANPASAVRAVKELSQWVARPDWDQILPTYSRCVRITRNESKTHTIDPGAFIEEAEKRLYNAVLEAETILENATPSPNTFLNAFLPMIPVVIGFFDGVLVMVDEKTVRSNRLGLLQRISALASGAADMSKLEGF
jgi:glycyl-tRNA synthetase